MSRGILLQQRASKRVRRVNFRFEVGDGEAVHAADAAAQPVRCFSPASFLNTL
jgi:hypothetical protein